MTEQTQLHLYPLVVDLDGAFLSTNTLSEALVDTFVSRGMEFGPLLASLGQGPAPFRREVSDQATLDYETLPVRQAVLSFLQEQQKLGRPIHLVSDADQSVVDKIAAIYPLFASAKGSDGVTLMRGAHKLDYLSTTFPDGFRYVGNSLGDVKIWKEAKSLVLAGAKKSVVRHASTLGVPIEAQIDTGQSPARTWIKALRLHQWAKNLLLFIPALLTVSETPLQNLLMCTIGFIVMGIAASATYLINDLADLPSDRRHKSKSRRPFASGSLSLKDGLKAIPLMLTFSLISAFVISPGFFGMLMLYLVVTLSYSFSLKRVALLDVVVLATLYTLRLFMGMVLVGVGSSPWLLSFALFFFFSMSLAKRHVEILAATGPADGQISGRGYRPGDWPLTLAMGAASTVASIMIIIQYLMAEAFASNTYSYPTALWMAPFAIGLWTCRIWLLAQRGELDDDPVAFATRDPQSLILGVVLGASFLAARFV